MKWLSPSVLLLASCLSAQSIHALLDTQATKVGFTLTGVAHTVHGTFKLTKGDLWIDPATGKAGGLLIVSTASGDSGSHARDNRMHKSILETKGYPEIRFSPDRIEGTANNNGDSAFRLHGLFTIHGATHELTMNVKSRIKDRLLTATANFDVPYVNWGMKDPSALFLKVSNTVQVDISAVGLIQ